MEKLSDRKKKKTDLEEFYAIADLSDFDSLQEKLSEWQFYYNWYRSHGSLKNKTPCDVVHALSEKTPLWEDIEKDYDQDNEHIQNPNYRQEMALRALKPCL